MGEKIYLYEYIDIVDPRNKLNEIEKRAKKENKYSWSILVEEIKNKVILNVFIKDFINKVNENIKFSNIYYKSNNKYIDEEMIRRNNENNEYFFKLQKSILFDLLENEKFYLFQKKIVYKEMDIIKKTNMKINTRNLKNESQLKLFINKYMEIFEKRKNIMKIIIKKCKKINTYYDDDLIINIKNNEDVDFVLAFIQKNNIKYNKIKLPKIIKIKENNNHVAKFYYGNNNITSYYHDIYKHMNSTFNTVDGKIVTYLIINNNEYNKCHVKQNTIFYNYYHYFDLWRKKHKCSINNISQFFITTT